MKNGINIVAMPVILNIECPDGQRSAVWKVTENELTLSEIALLTKGEQISLSSIINPGRRLEWLAVRVLLKELYPIGQTIDYLKNGKPFLVNNADKISITHSGKMVGIALHPTKTPGIDIEAVGPRIFKIAHRFLSESEKIYLGATPSIEQLLIIWGAKEVMYKVFEHGEVSFKNNFSVEPFALSDKGPLNGIIQKDGRIVYIPMEYIKMEDFILVQTNYL